MSKYTRKHKSKPATRRQRRPVPQTDQAARFKRTRSAHATEIAEDYVEAIAELIDSVGEARVVDLARVLGVSHVTVIRTIARLAREGLVTAQPYRSIFLTPRGGKLASTSRHRHSLVLDFLIALGVPPATADADAEGIEHHVSPATLQAMARFLHNASVSSRTH